MCAHTYVKVGENNLLYNVVFVASLIVLHPVLILKCFVLGKERVTKEIHVPSATCRG